jgi:hypothetical protein
MKVCDGCGRDTLTEFAWLIEADGAYWNGKFPDRRGFTTDVNDAVRFVRREDAEVLKWWILETWAFALRTVRHSWDNGTHQ